MMLPVRFDSVGATEILVKNAAREARLLDMEPELMAATDLVYEATRQWYDSRGGGSWPPLAASTIARKAIQGYADPERPLYAEGNLYESATSPNGPHSFRLPVGLQGVVIGVDWAEGGWQIPVVHFYGTTTAGRNHDVTIPARPIWPRAASGEYAAMREAITALMLRGI